MENKRPSFQFYPKDWLSDLQILLLSPEYEGAYIRMLAYCWVEDGLPLDDDSLAKISRLNEGWFKGGSTALLKFFYEGTCEGGRRLFNKRLDLERAKQNDWLAKSREGGLKSAAKRAKEQSKGGSTKPTSSRPLEPRGNSSTATSSSNIVTTNVVTSSQKVFTDEVMKLSDFLKACISKNSPSFKGDPRKWDDDIDKMIRLDNRKAIEVAHVIRFCQEDDFWRANILSGRKLREKYDQLFLKAKGSFEQKQKTEVKSYGKQFD